MAKLNPDIALIDFDLKSCYTSVILGLFHEDLNYVQMALEDKALWETIRRSFEDQNQGKACHKPAVKVCVYASFFGIGSKAMIGSIGDNVRLDLGLTKPEWKIWPGRLKQEEKAQHISSLMQNNGVGMDFRNLALKVGQIYDGELLTGPTGHSYLVLKPTFRTA